MKYFWYRHRKLYARSLWASVIAVVLLGTLNVRAQMLGGPDLATASGSAWSSLQLPDAGPQAAGSAAPSEAVTSTGKPILMLASDAVGSGNSLGIGQSMNNAKFGPQHWPALYQLWNHESGWNAGAVNRSSGACGIPQALPCSKIPDMSTPGQITWGLNYIAARYGNPTNAWAFWQTHHWY